MAKDVRTHKFINRGVQLSMAGEVILHSLLFLALVALILFAPPFVTLFSKYSAEDHQAIAKELYELNVSKWPLFAGLAVYTGVVSILFSHRIVGPAYQLRRTILSLAEGNLGSRVTLRKADYLGDLRDSVNVLADRIQKDLALVSSEQKEALEVCRRLNSPELEERLKSIEKVLGNYQGI